MISVDNIKHQIDSSPFYEHFFNQIYFFQRFWSIIIFGQSALLCVLSWACSWLGRKMFRYMNRHMNMNSIIFQFTHKDWSSNYKKYYLKLYNLVHTIVYTFGGGKFRNQFIKHRLGQFIWYSMFVETRLWYTYKRLLVLSHRRI